MKSFNGVVPSFSTTSQRIQGPILILAPWNPHSPLYPPCVSGRGGGGVLDLDRGGGTTITLLTLSFAVLLALTFLILLLNLLSSSSSSPNPSHVLHHCTFCTLISNPSLHLPHLLPLSLHSPQLFCNIS